MTEPQVVMGQVTWVNSHVSRALPARPFRAKSAGDNSILAFALAAAAVVIICRGLLGQGVIAGRFERCHCETGVT